MNYSTSYEVTPELQNESISQFFFQIMLRPKIVFFILLVAILIGSIFIDAPYWATGFVAGVLLMCVIFWVKTYVGLKKHARMALSILDEPTIKVELNEEHIENISSSGNRKYSWNTIETVKETKDFMILMNGKLPLMNIPKAHFSDEALAFIKSKVQYDGAHRG